MQMSMASHYKHPDAMKSVALNNVCKHSNGVFVFYSSFVFPSEIDLATAVATYLDPVSSPSPASFLVPTGFRYGP